MRLKRLLPLSSDHLREFTSSSPYAVISFVGTHTAGTKPVQLTPSNKLKGRLVVHADDCTPTEKFKGKALTVRQARRIARFVLEMTPDIETLVVSCQHGLGRSAGAAIGIAVVLGLPWQVYANDPYAPNPHILLLVRRSLADELRRTFFSNVSSTELKYDEESLLLAACLRQEYRNDFGPLLHDAATSERLYHLLMGKSKWDEPDYLSLNELSSRVGRIPNGLPGRVRYRICNQDPRD